MHLFILCHGSSGLVASDPSRPAVVSSFCRANYYPGSNRVAFVILFFQAF